MALGLTQGEMDSFAGEMMSLLPTETVTYTGAVDSGSKTIHFPDYTRHEISTNPALLDSRRVRIDTSLLTDPQQEDVIVRSSGQKWEVMSVTGGPPRPFWFLQVHRGD